MMRILYIDVNYKNSSTGNIVYSLHSNCLKNKIESAVCYGRGQRFKEHNVFKFGIDLETAIHAFLTRLTGYTGCFSLFSTNRLIKFIKKFNPDIVHIHELHAYFVNIKQLLVFLKKANIPVVFTNHCEFLYTGKCGHSKECSNYSASCGHCPHLRDYPKSLFFDRTHHMIKQKKEIFDNWEKCVFVSPSLWLNRKMETSFLKNKNRCVIHNGINTSIFNLKNQDNKENKTIVLSLAPDIMSELKGGKRVLEVAKMFLDTNVLFYLVGEKNNVKVCLPKNVKIFPITNNKEELVSYYNKASLFLICSSFETFPTTSLEAQCCGLPVIGFDVGGVKETILPNHGNTVPYLDYSSLCKEIKTYLMNEIDRSRISDESIKTYSNESMFQKYLSLYNQLL